MQLGDLGNAERGLVEPRSLLVLLVLLLLALAWFGARVGYRTLRRRMV